MDPTLTRLEQGGGGVQAGRRRIGRNRAQVALNGLQPAVDERPRTNDLGFVVGAKAIADTRLQRLLQTAKTAISEPGAKADDRGLRDTCRDGERIGRTKGYARGVAQDRLRDSLVVRRELLETFANAI